MLLQRINPLHFETTLSILKQYESRLLVKPYWVQNGKKVMCKAGNHVFTAFPFQTVLNIHNLPLSIVEMVFSCMNNELNHYRNSSLSSLSGGFWIILLELDLLDSWGIFRVFQVSGWGWQFENGGTKKPDFFTKKWGGASQNPKCSLFKKAQKCVGGGHWT